MLRKAGSERMREHPSHTKFTMNVEAIWSLVAQNIGDYSLIGLCLGFWDKTTTAIPVCFLLTNCISLQLMFCLNAIEMTLFQILAFTVALLFFHLSDYGTDPRLWAKVHQSLFERLLCCCSCDGDFPWQSGLHSKSWRSFNAGNNAAAFPPVHFHLRGGLNYKLTIQFQKQEKNAIFSILCKRPFHYREGSFHCVWSGRSFLCLGSAELSRGFPPSFWDLYIYFFERLKKFKVFCLANLELREVWSVLSIMPG